MRVFVIHIKNTEDGHIGYGVKVDGKPVDCTDLTQEENLELRGIIESVNIKLYHEVFIGEYGKCPSCKVKSIFGNEPQDV